MSEPSLPQIGIGVDVHADDVVPQPRQFSTNPARAGARVQDGGAARNHRINQPRLTIQVRPLRTHGFKSFDVPLRMSRVSLFL